MDTIFPEDWITYSEVEAVPEINDTTGKVLRGDILRGTAYKRIDLVGRITELDRKITVQFLFMQAFSKIFF